MLVRILLSTAILFAYIVILARTFGSRTFATWSQSFWDSPGIE